MTRATLTVTSKNYGAWSLRGWLLCQLAGLELDEIHLPSDDPLARAELLLLAPSFRVPSLSHEGVTVWGTLAIAEYLHERFPEQDIFPKDVVERAHCRSICDEMHSGFTNLRAGLPMNLKAHYPGFKIWAGAQADIDRIVDIWHECLARSGGPYLFGASPSAADAMFAPVCTRFATYDVELDRRCAAYRDAILDLPAVRAWIADAELEPDELEELDAEF
ncbi:MAG: glutathione S-transferase [Acidimicrobiia bacterium]